MKFRHAAPVVTVTLAAAVFAVVIPSARAQQAGGLAVPSAQEGQIIAVIEIRGVKNTNPEVARLAVAGAGLREGQPYRQEAAQAARAALGDRGLYSDALIRTEPTLGENKVRVIVEVFENPVIVKVSVTGNRSIPAEKILPLLDSKPGQVVNIVTINEDAKRIQRIYRNQGYEAFLSEVGDVFDPKTGVLTFPVTETIIDSIEIEGLKKTKEFVVTREMRSKVGEAFNANTLKRDITRIYGTGLFADVQSARPEPVGEGRVKLVIPVQEQRTGQVQVGFGYSVRQRLTGTLELSEQNFRGRGQGVSASWTVGGLVARNQFELGFSEPWLDKNHTSLSVNLYSRFNFLFNRVFSSNATDGTNNNPYYEERRGGAVTLSRPLSEFTRLYGTVRTEGIRANNVSPDYIQLSNDQINTLRGSLVQNGGLTSLTLRSVTNTRDNEQDPVSGTYLSPSVEFGAANFKSDKPNVNPAYIGPNALGDNVTPDEPRVFVEKRKQNGGFTKFNLDLRQYVNLSRTPRASIREAKRVLATRLLVGTATGNIGFTEQYFVGGADDLRGYADQRFWGNNLFVANAELRLPVEKRGDFTAVLFADYGDAWGASDVNRENVPGFGQHLKFSPHLGIGAGARVRTPVGLVRLDYGFGQTQRFHFSIGQAF